MCTGYSTSFALFPEEISPVGVDTPEYDAAPFGSNFRRYSRLYQSVFSRRYSDSLAFVGPYLIVFGFGGADLISQELLSCLLVNSSCHQPLK